MKHRRGSLCAQLMTNTHIIEVFVHEDEAKDDTRTCMACRKRTREHAVNAVKLVLYPKELEKDAGTGQRQGFEDSGPARQYEYCLGTVYELSVKIS